MKSNEMINTIQQCEIFSNGPSLILGNGSERGDYISCEKVLWSMGKKHDAIQIMKTYYPHDPDWTVESKLSKTKPSGECKFAWDYSYDDYDPYDMLESASKTRSQLEDIKQLGSDIHLTLTLDIALNDDELIDIFQPLSAYGKIYLRINHESNGYWFRHNKQYTYREVGSFFVRCHKVIKNISTNIKTVFSLSADAFVGDGINSIVTQAAAHLAADELKQALYIADYWSIDKYVSLNWGWPHTTPDDSNDYFSGSIDTWWRLLEETYLLMISMNDGVMKPLFISEFNVDSDVVGEKEQAKTIEAVYTRIEASQFKWLAGICMYQYCDEGGLGLVKGTEKSYQATESLVAYRKKVHDFPANMTISADNWSKNGYTFSWESSDYIKGIKVNFECVKKTFTNRLYMPVYILQNSSWHYIRPNKKHQLNSDEIIIFIPPSKKVHSMRINYCHAIKDIESRLEAMFD